jgi:hypothetical protein
MIAELTAETRPGRSPQGAGPPQVADFPRKSRGCSAADGMPPRGAGLDVCPSGQSSGADNDEANAKGRRGGAQPITRAAHGCAARPMRAPMSSPCPKPPASLHVMRARVGRHVGYVSGERIGIDAERLDARGGWAEQRQRPHHAFGRGSATASDLVLLPAGSRRPRNSRS